MKELISQLEVLPKVLGDYDMIPLINGYIPHGLTFIRRLKYGWMVNKYQQSPCIMEVVDCKHRAWRADTVYI